LLVFTTDKVELLRHFRKDPVLFSYHIGDLDDFQFEHCQWAAAYEGSSRIRDVILVYTGLATPSVQAFGVSGLTDDLVVEMLDLLPNKFYCHFQRHTGDMLVGQYNEQPLGTHLKMKLESFKPVNTCCHASIICLNSAHERQLCALYDTAYPGNYFDARMLATGKYLGILEDGELRAVSGVHVCSDEYGIAVLGNIATHPSHRGKGLATALTSKLVAGLVEEGKLICLNVKNDNLPAIHCYEKLGFKRVHEYQEALFERRTP